MSTGATRANVVRSLRPAARTTPRKITAKNGLARISFRYERSAVTIRNWSRTAPRNPRTSHVHAALADERQVDLLEAGPGDPHRGDAGRHQATHHLADGVLG